MHIRRPNHGFSLIETIMVLAVVGIVMGAIWAAYATATRYAKNEREEQQIGDLVAVTRDYLQQFNENNSPLYYNTAGGINVATNITRFFDPTNVAPNPTIPLPTSVRGYNSTAKTIQVESGTAAIWIFPSIGNPYGTGPLINVSLAGLDQAACQAVVNDWGGSPDRIQSSGLVSVNPNTLVLLNSANISGSNLFATPGNLTTNANALATTAIVAACPNATGNTVALIFRLNK